MCLDFLVYSFFDIFCFCLFCWLLLYFIFLEFVILLFRFRFLFYVPCTERSRTERSWGTHLAPKGPGAPVRFSDPGSCSGSGLSTRFVPFRRYISVPFVLPFSSWSWPWTCLVCSGCSVPSDLVRLSYFFRSFSRFHSSKKKTGKTEFPEEAREPNHNYLNSQDREPEPGRKDRRHRDKTLRNGTEETETTSQD